MHYNSNQAAKPNPLLGLEHNMSGLYGVWGKRTGLLPMLESLLLQRHVHIKLLLLLLLH